MFFQEFSVVSLPVGILIYLTNFSSLRNYINNRINLLFISVSVFSIFFCGFLDLSFVQFVAYQFVSVGVFCVILLWMISSRLQRGI